MASEKVVEAGCVLMVVGCRNMVLLVVFMILFFVMEVGVFCGCYMDYLSFCALV